ncbi:MAG: LysR family transcriptional regulator [Hyphomicrobiaceae bacterium]|nr:LysR family transcriptional regulator [Hyphomicrobiaceae bacterium]
MTGWINHRQVEAFHVVMLTGSMTAAGELLGISQPAVSRLIREFESKVGFALFQRHGGNIKPTREAIMLHSEVDRSIQSLSRIESAAQGIARLKSDTLRITGTLGLSSAYLARAVARLEEKYPEVSITVSTDTTPSVVNKMLINQFDVGIAFFANDVHGLDIEPLKPVEGVCILPKGHPLCSRSEIHVEDLAGVPLVCQEKETQTQYKVLAVFRAADVEPSVKIEANLATMIYKLVEAGSGAAIVEPITAKEMESDDLCIKPFHPTIQFEPGIAFPANRPRSEIAQSFADNFKQLFDQDFGSSWT